MRAFTFIFSLILNFATIISYFAFLLDMPFSQEILALKDVFLFMGLALASSYVFRRASNGQLDTIDLLIGVIVLVNLISFGVSNATVSDKLINLRRNLSFLMILVVFRELGIGFKNPLNLFRLIKGTLVLIWIFGLLEFLLPDEFWDKTIEITKYWTTLSIDPFATSTIAESGRFYSWDLLGVVGVPIRRMVSIYFEPTTLAAFFTACFCVCLGQRQKIWAAFIVFFGCLTISKFFILSTILALSLFRFRDKLKKHMLISVVGISMLVSAIVLILEIESGALLHLKGITSVVEIIHEQQWLGLGLGAAGNYSDADSATAEIGAESGFGNVVAQLGLGIIFYVWLLNTIYLRLLEAYKKNRDPIYAAAICALCCWSMSFMMSASSMGMSGNSFFFIFIGAVLYKLKKT